MRKTWIMIAVVLIMNSHSVWSEQIIGESDYLDNVNEYSRAAEPPVQCGVSHLSRRTEPHCL